MEARAPQGFIPVVAATEPQTRRGSAATDLPKPKSVDATEKVSSVRTGKEQLAEEEARRAQNRDRQEEARARSHTDVKTHAATGSIVIQTLHADNGDVLHQFPDNVTLKQRAIARYQALQGAPEIKRTV